MCFTLTDTHTDSSHKEEPPGPIVKSQQIAWNEWKMRWRELMERCADWRDEAPEGEAMIRGGGGGRGWGDGKNKRVCGRRYLKGLDKVSVTDSVRSGRIWVEAVTAARLLEVRLMGAEVTKYGQGRVHTRSWRFEYTQACNTYPCRESSNQEALINTNGFFFL